MLVAAGCGREPEEPGPALAFVEVTDESGIDFVHTGGPDPRLPYGNGAAFVDCDRDGHLDLWLTRRSGPSALYRALGDGTFEDVSVEAGIDDPLGDKAGVVPADYDNDGRVDVFVARVGASALYRAVGDCRFEEVGAAVGVAGAGATQAAAWGDFDGDGWLDLATIDHSAVDLPAPGEEPDRSLRLFQGGPDGRFVDRTGWLPVEHRSGAGFAVVWFDPDEDGDADLYAINDHFPETPGNRLFRNDGPGLDGWVFEEAGAEAALDLELSGMGVALGDVDGDGHVDLAMSNIGAAPLLRARGDGTFEDITREWGVGRTGWKGDSYTSWGLLFADFDADGWLDHLIAGGGLPGWSAREDHGSALYRGDGAGFADVTAGSGIELEDGSTRTVVRGDVDGDGLPDVLAVDWAGRARLFRTEPRGGRTLVVTLEGTQSNRSGLGARVELEGSGGYRATRWLASGESLGGGHELALFFGLGEAEPQVLSVTWPTGTVQQVQVHREDRVHVVEAP